MALSRPSVRTHATGLATDMCVPRVVARAAASGRLAQRAIQHKQPGRPSTLKPGGPHRYRFDCGALLADRRTAELLPPSSGNRTRRSLRSPSACNAAIMAAATSAGLSCGSGRKCPRTPVGSSTGTRRSRTARTSAPNSGSPENAPCPHRSAGSSRDHATAAPSRPATPNTTDL